MQSLMLEEKLVAGGDMFAYISSFNFQPLSRMIVFRCLICSACFNQVYILKCWCIT